MQVFLRLRIGVEVHHFVAGVGVVFGPVGQACAVGVAIFGEVAPIFADQVGEGVIFRAPADPGFGIERAEDEFDFGGVVGAGFIGAALRIFRMIHIEAVAVDGGFASF